MPHLEINQNQHFYRESDVVNLDEGLIGLPNLRRASILRLPDFEPFMWLASIENANTRFLVVEPAQIFADYQPQFTADVLSRLDLAGDENPLILTIVKISSDWLKTTVNLKAPILINSKIGRGTQAVLTGTDFRLDQTLPESFLTA